MKMNLLLLAALLLPAHARAQASLEPPVQVEVTGFKAKLSEGRVELSWRRYRREDFLSYTVVKSDKEAEPVHPGAPVVASFLSRETRSVADGRLSEGAWRYRLVITTRFGDRWVSPAVPIVIGAADVRRPPPVASDFDD
jgi:hypothetical protein